MRHDHVDVVFECLVAAEFVRGMVRLAVCRFEAVEHSLVLGLRGLQEEESTHTRGQ